MKSQCFRGAVDEQFSSCVDRSVVAAETGIKMWWQFAVGIVETNEYANA